MNDYLKAIIIFLAVSLILGVVVVSAVNIIDGREIFSTQLIGTISNGVGTNTVTNAANTNSNTNTAVNNANTASGVQAATLKVARGNYVLTPSVFKKGVPIRITADIANMPGCSKSFTIPDFNIRKSLSTSDNIIEFTPDKSGTFRMACTMNMYTGSLTITDDGNAPTGIAAQQQAQAASNVASKSGGSGSGCSMGSGGGCGCGG